VRRYTNEELFELARELDDKAGGELSGREFCRKTGVSSSVIPRRFGRWRNFLAAANLPERPTGMRRARRYSREAILIAMRGAIRVLGSNITFQQFYRHTGISGGTVECYFGSWADLREAAGLERRIFGNPKKRIHTCERLAYRLQDAVKELGTHLNCKDFCRTSGIAGSTINHYFGTWEKLREYAGVGPQPRKPRRFTDDELLADLHRVATAIRKFPRVSDFSQRGEHARPTLLDRFGGTWKAVEVRYRNWLYTRYPAVEKAIRTAPSGGVLLKTTDLVKLVAR
jgi:hypothetical protein